eukprot:scaffold126109_cov41-Tisochrysis_lutea.AAC.2
MGFRPIFRVDATITVNVSPFAHLHSGAFLLTSGYALKPDKSCGGVFMQHGLEITFHTVVDFTRLAYAA